MSNRDEYTSVNGYSVDPYVRRKPSRRPETFRVKCAFCRGTGVHPGTVMNDDCPSCGGKGWHQFEGNPDDYGPCGRCRGTGRQQEIVFDEPCHICGGSGIV